MLLGRKPASTLDLVFLPAAKRDQLHRIGPFELYEKLVEDLENMQELHNENKRRNRKEVLKGSRGKLEKFIEGDFVLIAKVKQAPGTKILLRWQGPFRVVKATGTHTYRVQHMVSKDTKEVHIQRIRKYADKDLNVTEELRAFAATQEQRVEVEKLIDVRRNPDTQRIEINVQWRGFGSEECTWEPASNIIADIPVLVKKLLRSLSKKQTNQRSLLHEALEAAGR